MTMPFNKFYKLGTEEDVGGVILRARNLGLQHIRVGPSIGTNGHDFPFKPLAQPHFTLGSGSAHSCLWVWAGQE